MQNEDWRLPLERKFVQKKFKEKYDWPAKGIYYSKDEKIVFIPPACKTTIKRNANHIW